MTISAAYLLAGNTTLRSRASRIVSLSGPRSTTYNAMLCADIPFGLKMSDSFSPQLSVLYLLGSSTTHITWPLIGLGIRFAQEKGLHRRNEKQKHTVEDESGKRVFWWVVCLIP